MSDPPPPPPDPSGPESPLPPHTGRWLLATLLVTALIVVAQLYPFRFSAGAGPVLAMRHAGYLAVLGQVALFVPLGFVETQFARRVFGSLGGLLALLVALDGAVLSFICQIVQHWLPDRLSSIVDLAANTLGTVIGYKLALLWRVMRG